MTKKKTAKKAAKKAAKKVTKKKSTKQKTAKKKTAKKVTKKKTAKKTAKKVTKKKTAKKAAKKVTKKKTAKKVAKKKTTKQKAAKKVAKKTAKKAAKKVTKKKTTKQKATKKVTKKTAKKSIKKKESTPEKASGGQEVETQEEVQEERSTPSRSELAKGEEPDLSDAVLTGKKKKQAEEVIKEKLAEGVIETAESVETNIRKVLAAIKVSDFYSSDSDECLERGCDAPATTLGYCRFHYIANWKDIKTKQRVLEEGKLQEAIEDLASKYPLRFIESMLSDLADEKTFFSVLKEMDIEGVEDSYDDMDDDGDDDQDIAFETKVTSKRMFEE